MVLPKQGRGDTGLNHNKIIGCKGADTHDNITDQRACDESIASIKGSWVTLPIILYASVANRQLR